MADVCDEAEREVLGTVGWLQGFASTVWLLPSATNDGVPLVADDVCEEYERRVNRLAEMMSIGGGQRCE